MVVTPDDNHVAKIQLVDHLVSNIDLASHSDRRSLGAALVTR